MTRKTARELHDECKHAYMNMKKNRVKEEGVGADNPPILHVVHEDLHLVVQGPLDQPDLREMACVAMGIAMKADAMCLAMEGYQRTGKANESVDTGLPRGALAQRFASGAEDTVEALIISSCGPEQNVLTSILPYRYGTSRADKINFELPGLPDDSIVEGITPNCLRTGMAFAQNMVDKAGPELDMDVLRSALQAAGNSGMTCMLGGGTSAMVDVLYPQERN